MVKFQLKFAHQKLKYEIAIFQAPQHLFKFHSSVLGLRRMKTEGSLSRTISSFLFSAKFNTHTFFVPNLN